MLVRPSLTGLLVENATKDIVFDFYVDKTSDQVFGHSIQVLDNLTNVIVHEHNTMSFLATCTIKSNTLLNGNTYKVRLRTYNRSINSDFSNSNSTNTSEWSDYMIIRCYSDADVEITNIPVDLTGNRVIRNQTFIFEGFYDQREGVGLKSYRYILYDRDRVLLQSYPVVYQTDGVLKQEVTGFRSNEEYYIELVTLNQYDIESRSILIDFRVDFQPPRVTQIFECKNDRENACVKIDTQIIQMLLKAEGNVTFDNYIKTTRVRELQEYLSNSLGDMSSQELYDLSYEIIERKQGEYSAPDGSPYNIIQIPRYFTDVTTMATSTSEEVFFVNLTEEGAKVWIDNKNGLNMTDEFTMNLWAEIITPDKTFLKIIGKNSTIEFEVRNGKVHCYEKNGTIIRHTVATISGTYDIFKPLHIFIQRRNGYMRVVARVVRQ